jgi:hypothetical protein
MSGRSAIAIAIAAGVGLCLGLVAGLALRGRDGGAPRAPGAEAVAGDADQRARIEALEAGLGAERDARRSLAAEVGLLRAALGSSRAPVGEPSAADTGEAAFAGEEAAEAEPAGEARPEWFDEASLVEAGLAAPDAARLREQFEAQELAELYLRDRAAREGWIGRPRFRQELRAQRDAFREALGDSDLDRILWASGRDNRVRVANVLQNSPAAGAAIAPGDHIVSYAGRRIFGAQELTELTRQGKAGEPVVVDLERDGVVRTEIVPRGPLGVTLQPARAAPDMLR